MNPHFKLKNQSKTFTSQQERWTQQQKVKPTVEIEAAVGTELREAWVADDAASISCIISSLISGVTQNFIKMHQ